jgi:bifunctional UDP-N-acetylglucosamine pyrophosphorylase/glucosamine-1-phosphate N-acetyltransferase
MKTLVLLAGQSKRFWPLSEKPLFPIVGKTLLEHIVGRLEKAGCSDITLIGSKYNLNDIATLANLPTIEQEKLELGMRGALLSALPACGEEDILIVGGNDIIDVAGYHATIEAGNQTGVEGAILGQAVKEYFPGGYLYVTDNKITGIVEKPGKGKEPSNLVNIVCHYHRNAATLLRALQAIKDGTDDGYEQALDGLFKKHTYIPVAYSGVWQAVKYPWHLLQLLPILLSEVSEQSIDSSAVIHESAVIQGNVIIGEGVRVMPHATIVGPCIIGEHAIVGNNALVRGSSIGARCVIGYNTEVKSSVLCSHVWTHSAYIGDSVIGENVSFGAGTVTGNLRLDEKEIFSQHHDEPLPTGLTKFGTIIGADSRIGIHVSINPGVKIGRGSFVSSNTLVDKDIANKTFAKMKNGSLDARENTAETPKPAAREKYKKTL